MNQQLLAGIILLFLHYQLLFVIVIPLVLWDLSVISYLLICSFVVPGFFLFVMAWLQFLFLFFLISEEISVRLKTIRQVVVYSCIVLVYQSMGCECWLMGFNLQHEHTSTRYNQTITSHRNTRHHQKKQNSKHRQHNR